MWWQNSIDREETLNSEVFRSPKRHKPCLAAALILLRALRVARLLVESEEGTKGQKWSPVMTGLMTKGDI